MSSSKGTNKKGTKGTDKRPFTLSGKVVGLTKDGRKLKGLKVKAGDTKYRVKLAKPLRQALPSDLNKGVPVQLLGTVKYKKGELRLKAEAIHVLDAPVPPALEISSEPRPSLDKAIAEATGPASAPPKAAAADVSAGQHQAAKKPIKVLICQKGSCWKKRRGQKICEQLEQRLCDRGLRDAVTIKKTGCMDRCKSGPNAVIMPGKVRISHIGRADVDKLIDQHIAAAK